MIENVFLFLYLLFLAPKIIFERFKGKRHPNFLQRLGFFLPKPDRPVIWIHAVSVGEVKAADPLVNGLKNYYLFITTTTATGQEEAKRSLPHADCYAYLPIDFTFVVKKFVKGLNPEHFILVETDFWPNLLKALKKNGTKISLVSGKMSERSLQRFQWVAPYSKRLFANFDHICVQNEEHFHNFSKFSTRVEITGNLKLDLKPQKVARFLDLKGPTITISCTHAPEEELILDALNGGPWTILLAPRHPERFDEVSKILLNRNIAFGRWSKNELGKCILVDAMGQLPICYAHSQLAILGGSFVNHIGGHNVLEPILYNTPVFFGPYMQKQLEFAKRVIDANAGKQLSIENLRNAVEQFFNDPNPFFHSAKVLQEQGRGAAEKTKNIIFRKNILGKIA